ncbi:Fasciclin-like arabinogalactan protein [Erysiphe neolycopersici]|uniref:Fasciclin-like arabinogalactan protein n=1 Tax=Erysiphe neolycopersici TaxID=212602 RepID=A0A420HN61_9PEZI|nr:Fasciclin-like arabinogalactan protein [Erysiphe neolycopersici]
MLYNKLIPFGFILTAAAQCITDVIARNSHTSTLNKFIQGLPEVESVLKNAKNITLLAPSNAAFDAFLKTDYGAAAASHPDFLANLLTYHILNGTYKASDYSDVPVFHRTLLTNSSYTSLEDGQRVKAQTANDSVIVTSGLLTTSRVIKPDVDAPNGIIHIIDTVLTIPASISDTAVAANLDSLVGALKKADLVDTIDDLSCATIFAPFDTAFSNASKSLSKLSDDKLKEVLKYHVLDKVQYSTDLADGSNVENIKGEKIHIDEKNYKIKVDSAQVLTSDVLVFNGVVHVIDEVLAVNLDKKEKGHDHKHDHDDHKGHDHKDHDHKDHDHKDHDHKDHESQGAAGPGAKITKYGVIALGTLILAQIFAL